MSSLMNYHVCYKNIFSRASLASTSTNTIMSSTKFLFVSGEMKTRKSIIYQVHYSNNVQRYLSCNELYIHKSVEENYVIEIYVD